MSSFAITTGPRRFLILGLPRSGTTYLMSLLNAHGSVLCAGEQFNPYAVIDTESEIRDFSAVLRRDSMPRKHAREFFESYADSSYGCVGYKLMIGHNIRVLKELPDLTGYSLIYVHRENKLAQISSLIKADKTQRWAQFNADAHVTQKIDVSPLRISHYWHEFATYDFLFSQWFDTLPQKKWKLEYCQMFQPGFERHLCDFLGLEPDDKMKSQLVKQGSNSILDRFKKPGPIKAYFTKLGREDWLGQEIRQSDI